MRELIYEYYADKSEKKIMNDLVEMQWKIKRYFYYRKSVDKTQF